MRMRSFFVVSVGAGLLVLAAACGGSDDDASGTNGGAGSGGSTTGPALAEIPAKLGGAYCALVDQCFGPLKATFLGAEDCATRFTRQFEDGDFPAIKAAIEGGKLTYDASKVQACVDAIAKGGCAQLDNRTPSVCDAVFGGKGAIGDACQTNAECASGTFCEPAAACPGKCAARKASGGACLADDACVDGLKCDATTKTCLAPGKAGEACGAGKPDCGPQLFCVGADESKKQSGTCKTYDEVFSVAEGASCGFTAGPLCKTGACAFDKLVSGQATFKCVPTAASGAACTVALPEQCPVGEYCPVDIQANKLTGTCTKLPKAGEACGKVLFGRQCADYTVCENGTCKETARIGGACALATTCYSGVCTSGACAAGPSCEPKKQ